MRFPLTVVILVLLSGHNHTSAQSIKRFDVLITEILPDPNPIVGLPGNEFIELTNLSAIPCNLKDWKIGDQSSTATITTSVILQPGSAVIICSNSAIPQFASFGDVIGVSGFPSLDNDADLITLRNKDGNVIHAVNYDQKWYQNDTKAEGGWSLEMIDTQNPCAGNKNWKASVSPTGGTPGKKNSVQAVNKDDVAPELIRTYGIDSITIAAVFDEPLETFTASVTTNYQLNRNPVNPSSAVPIGPMFDEVHLKFSLPFSPRETYTLNVRNISDCSGNMVGSQNIAKTGFPSVADTSDIIINEILFNPKADGFDFFEIYNRSSKIIDLQYLYCANRNATGNLINIQPLSRKPYLLFPEEFLVFTTNEIWLRQNYLVKNFRDVIELSSFPSLPDDMGSLVVINIDNKKIDELRYDSKWHFALINDDEGISLERIDYSVSTQNQNNWTSAASTAGFATPGYQNSQFKADFQLQGSITTNPKIFSPDNDGMDDNATIAYQVTQPGFVANITIFDSNGRAVRYLAKNATLASQGSFRWDGLDDQSQLLPMGIYIVFTEIFNLQGKSKRYKNVLTLARKF